MAESSYLINLSVLYRNVQKYFDKAMAEYDIGSGQLTFLFLINEHEGITMQELSRIQEVDKGTTTKGVQKLLDKNYVQSRTDEKDRRIKRLYMTEEGSAIMNHLYSLRNECRSRIATNMDIGTFENLLEEATKNSRMYLNPEPAYAGIKIGGLQKMTLLDYPGKVAATIFTGGCNFKCPFCHNRDLVFLPDAFQFFDPDDVLAYLDRRKGILDGVCISGGEPLMQDGLEDYIRQIKEKGFLVKLDTNGYFPDRLKNLCATGLIDYVAMDIKNTPAKYGMTCGLNEDVFRPEHIQESIDFLMQGTIDYEFRTTVVRELHTKEDLIEMAKRIRGCRKYFLQQYTDSGHVIQPGWTACNFEEMTALRDAVRKYVPNTELRGVKEG